MVNCCNRRHKREAYTFILLLFFTVFVRLALIAFYPKINRDSLVFMKIAKNVAEGQSNGFGVNSVQPLFPMMIGGLNWIGIPLDAAGYFIDVICSVIFAACSYFIVLELFKNRAAGLLFMSFCAFHPIFIEINKEILRDSLYLAVFSLFVLFEIRFILRRKYSDILLLGCICGISPWIRNEGVELLGYSVILFFSLLVYNCFNPNEGFKGKKRVAHVCLYIMGLFLASGSIYMLSAQFGVDWYRQFSHVQALILKAKTCLI